MRRLSWALMALVALVALAYGAAADDGPRTNAERASRLANTIACPQCNGESVGQSNAPIADIIRTEINQQVDAGLTDDQIRAIYVERYGEWVNLTPPASGIDAWVWIAPFLLIGVAAGGVGLALVRWREPARAGALVRAAERSDAAVAARLDPDGLALLTDERAFLAQSIVDLRREHEAGDLSDEDFEALHDDYTRRHIEVDAAITEEREAYAAAPPLGRGQVGRWVLGLAVLGVVVGVTLAQTSGSRLASDEITGGVRQGTLSLLNDARALLGQPDQWDTAISLYDEALEQSPANTEALTYRVWLVYRQGGTVAEAMSAWDEVVRIDATYPDVRVFRAIALTNDEQFAAARVELEAFDALDPPEVLSDLVNREGLRGTVYGEVLLPELAGAGRVTLEGLGVSATNALAAGDYLVTGDAAAAAFKLYVAVEEAEPDNPAALVRVAAVLTAAGQTAEATARLDRLDALPAADVPDAVRAQADDIRATIAG